MKQVGVQTNIKAGVTGSVGAYTPTSPTPPAPPPSNPSAIVAGAGTAAANGTYTLRGTSNAKPYYNLVGQPDDPSNYAISWEVDLWTLWGGGAFSGFGYYTSGDDVAFPWLAAFTAQDGDPPAPTVSHS